MGIFQSDDRSADRLLRQVQDFGGTGHVLAFGDSDEDAQLLEGHAVSITPNVEACPRLRGSARAQARRFEDVGSKHHNVILAARWRAASRLSESASSGAQSTPANCRLYRNAGCNSKTRAAASCACANRPSKFASIAAAGM